MAIVVGLACLVGALGAIGAAAPTAHAQCARNPMQGVWRHNDHGWRQMTYAMIDFGCNDTSDGSTPAYVRMLGDYGRGYDCDWGQVQGQAMTGIYAGWIRAIYHPRCLPNSQADVWLTPTYMPYLHVTWLHVWTYIHFSDGHPDITSDQLFSPYAL